MSCETLADEHTYIRERLETVMREWSKAIQERTSRVGTIMRDWETTKTRVEEFLSDKGTAVRDRAVRRLERFLDAEDKGKVADEEYRFSKRDLDRVLKSDPIYIEKKKQMDLAEATVRRLQKSLDSLNIKWYSPEAWGLKSKKLDVPLLRHFRGLETSEDSLALKQAQAEVRRSIATNKEIVQQNMHDIEQLRRNILENHLSLYKARLVQAHVTEVNDLHRGFEDFKLQLKASVQEFISFVQEFQEELMQLKAQYTKTETEWQHMLEETSVEIEAACKAAVKQARKILNQMDPDFLERFLKRSGDDYRMLPPPSLSKATSKCAPPAAGDAPRMINPMQYQRLVADLFARDKDNDAKGLLVYHDMGTGKTCSIVMIVSSLYRYYAQNPISAAPPIAMIYVQSNSSLANYVKQVNVGCGSGELWENVPVHGKDSTLHYKVLNPSNKRVVMQVVIHRMTVQLPDKIARILRDGYEKVQMEKDYCGNMVSVPSDPQIVVPHRGIVIVDEAHNLIDPSQIKAGNQTVDPNMSVWIKKQLFQRRDIPLVLATGTPVIGENIGNLIRLLDLVRRPCNLSQYLGVLKNDEISYEKEDLIEKYFTETALSREAKAVPESAYFASKKKEPEPEPEVDARTFEWKENMEKFVYYLIHAYISFITLSRDPERYPRLVAKLMNHGPLLKGGFVVDVSIQNGIPDFSNITQNSSARDPATILYIPTSQQHWEVMNPKVSGATLRRRAGQPIPNKWYVMLYLMTYPPYRAFKHFLYHPSITSSAEWNSFRRHSSTTQDDMGFISWIYSVPDMHDPSRAAGILEIPYQEEIFAGFKEKVNDNVGKYGELALEVTTKELVDKWYAWFDGLDPSDPIRRARDRCAYLRKDTTTVAKTSPFRATEVLLGIYNHERNKTGTIIRYLFANGFHKEGIDVKMTQIVHITEPPSSRNHRMQAQARITRFCSFALEEDIKRWETMSFVYVAKEPEGYSGDKNSYEVTYIQQGNMGSPSELMLDLMEKSALDCELYKNYLQRGECFLNTLNTRNKDETMVAMRNGYCWDPTQSNVREGTLRPAVVGFVKDDRGGINTLEDCYANQMVPGKLLEYTEKDAEMYLLLQHYGYKVKALSNRNLLKQFDQMVRRAVVQKVVDTEDRAWGGEPQEKQQRRIMSRLLGAFHVGAWNTQNEEQQNSEYRLSISFDHGVQVLTMLRWLQYNPPAIGNAVLFLLDEKRNAADPEYVEELDKRVRNRVVAHQIITDRRHKTEQIILDILTRIDDMQAGLKQKYEYMMSMMHRLNVRWEHDYEDLS